MLYLFDDAICNDLIKSFNPVADGQQPVVKVVSPEAIIGLAAQIQEDKIGFPLIAVTRNPYQIDNNRLNFTRSHFGIASVIDKETNMLYYEKALPITLSYNLTILTTNQADMDELIRELLFKYVNMYFLTIQLPYESDRKVRFGITINGDTEIERSSGNLEYIENGTLYQSIITLQCDGCCLVTYTPAHLMRYELDDSVHIQQ